YYCRLYYSEYYRIIVGSRKKNTTDRCRDYSTCGSRFRTLALYLLFHDYPNDGFSLYGEICTCPSPGKVRHVAIGNDRIYCSEHRKSRWQGELRSSSGSAPS